MVRTYQQKNKFCKNTKLPEKQTYLIVRSFVELDTTSECAEKIGVSIPTVKKHYAALGERLYEILEKSEFPDYHFDNLVFDPVLAFILTPLSKIIADELVPKVTYQQYLSYKNTGAYEGLASTNTGKLVSTEYCKRLVFEQLGVIASKRKNISKQFFYRHLALARYRALVVAHFINFKFNKTLHKKLGSELFPENFDYSAHASGARTGIILDSLVRRPLEL